MNPRVKMADKFEVGRKSKRGMMQRLITNTRWQWEKWRLLKPDGPIPDLNEIKTMMRPKGLYYLVDTWEHGNLVTNEGLNANLDIMFHASTQITTWYIFPFEDDHTPLVTNT